jgi:hypothetical protein
VNLKGRLPADTLFLKRVREKALQVFAEEPETVEPEFDFRELFLRRIWEEDWTDKLVSAFEKVRSRIHLRREDTKLPEELRMLIPDMKQVEEAYFEMTNDYREFIKSIWEARHRLKETSEEAAEVSS